MIGIGSSPGTYPDLASQAGRSDRDWSLEKLARQLHAVIGVAGEKPVTLLGHSIGVMIILTYCKVFPQGTG